MVFNHPAGGADDTKLPVFHEPYGDALQKSAHSSLVQKPRRELAAAQKIVDAVQDAAG
jgi:hypothetical protein